MDKKKLSDSDLVILCKKELPADTSAFRELVRRYKDYIYRISLQKLHNKTDAEDATQEAFIRIFHGINKFRMNSELKTWITVITGNVCLSILLSKKQKFWKHHVTVDGNIDLENIHAMLVSAEHEFDFWRRIGEILRKMYSGYRRVFIFKYFKNFTMKQISDKIKATLAATKMRVKRAKDQFIRIFIRT